MVFRNHIVLISMTIFLAVSCSATVDQMGKNANNNHNDPAQSNNAPLVDTQQTSTAPTGKGYVGFGGVDLVADRKPGVANTDRIRIKPYSVLTGEYPRVLGAVPSTLNGARATFGDTAPPWFVEPRSSSQIAYAAFSVAFDGCLTFTASAAAYNTAPTAESSSTVCDTWSHAFWSRAPSSAELAECVAAAQGTSGEANARRRWAYMCAGLLSSAGFLTY